MLEPDRTQPSAGSTSTDALDGVEDGLWALGTLAARGVRVFNRAGRAARRPRQAADGARPGTGAAAAIRARRCCTPTGPRRPGPVRVVVKPRFGSWRIDVDAVRERGRLAGGHLHALRAQPCVPAARARSSRSSIEPRRLRPPHRRRGAGSAVGAISRVAAKGGMAHERQPRRDACARRPAHRRARARRVGRRRRGHRARRHRSAPRRRRQAGTVLELNGAVDFTSRVPDRPRSVRRRRRRSWRGRLRTEPAPCRRRRVVVGPSAFTTSPPRSSPSFSPRERPRVDTRVRQRGNESTGERH